MRNSNERSEKYWHKRTTEALSKLEKVFSDLKITTMDMIKKKPQDIAFIPVQLLLDIVDKEHKAVETMINLNKLEDNAAEERKQRRKEARAKEQAALESGSETSNEELEKLHKKYLNVELTPEMIKEIENGFTAKEKKTNGRMKKVKAEPSTLTASSYIADSSDESDVEEANADEAAYSHLYVPEPLSSYEMQVCAHGKVPLMNVLQGEIKAVKKSGAEKLLKDYGLKIRKKTFHHLEGGTPNFSHGHLLSGTDLCIDCALDLRKEAIFSASLDDIEDFLDEVLKDPNRQVRMDSDVSPTDYIVSRKDLTNYRKLALQQREYKTLVNQERDAVSLVFSTNTEVNGDVKNGTTGIGSPKSKKRRMSEDEPKVEYKAHINPESPLKLKILMRPTNGDGKTNGVVNGRIKKAPVASDESSTESESEEEMETDDGEDDPDWDGRETGYSHKRKLARGTGTPKKKKKKTVKSKQANSGSDEEPDIIIPKQPVLFNVEIACPHGNVKQGPKIVRLSHQEWMRVVMPYFDEPEVIRGDRLNCFHCEEEKVNEALSNKQNRDILSRINNDISLLMKTLEKRRYTVNELGHRYTNIICGKFLDNFRTAAKSRSSSVSVPLLCQGCLICDHGRPFVDFTRSQVAGNAMPITQKEWREIHRAYKTHFPGHDGDLVEIKVNTEGKHISEEMVFNFDV